MSINTVTCCKCDCYVEAHNIREVDRRVKTTLLNPDILSGIVLVACNINAP